MRKNPLDFCKKVVNKLKSKYKNREIKLATIAIIIMGCFFYGDYIKNSLFLEVKAEELDKSSEIATVKVPESWNLNNKEDEFNFVLKKEEEDILKNEYAKLELEIKNITKDHPIEEMAPFIAKYDNKIAALIVGIAKKESNWGKRSPSKNGQTCYNYWGYKGQGSRGLGMGYGCFASPEEAVNAIGGRISELVNQNIDTPAEMVVWKCGRSCAATGGQAAANKWIADVNVYYKRIAMLAS
ncbi:MAG: hypothetical protein UR51_C0011G0023 [Candidatus Moranbacteria bacterium GW2011_GWF1_34_10]|nr:MAG: hypothetical protein UR51_C0011G0023 [Candidatus Moranbacteria bacterium GW2011_GWF1_34_10]